MLVRTTGSSFLCADNHPLQYRLIVNMLDVLYTISYHLLVQSHISCTLQSHTFSTTNLQTTISIWNNNTSEHLTSLDGRIPTRNKRDKCLVVTKAFVTSIVTCRCLPWRSFNSDALVATCLRADCKIGKCYYTVTFCDISWLHEMWDCTSKW
jgi:hypothetical protein